MHKPARLFFSTRPLGPLSIALLCIGLLCGFRPYAAPPASAAPVALRVIDRDADDANLPQYAQRGERWIAATPGHRYALRLTNRSDRRVLVVLSVDGVNAVSGQTASSDQRGYVLAPWQSTEIAGWRKSQREIAQFVFTDLADSYAARTGRPDNVGVIGMAVFDEAPTIVPQASVEQDSEERYSERAAAPVAAAPAAAARAQESDAARGKLQRLGTGHGEREWSPSSVTEFERASELPQQRLQLRYDSHARLVARGVIPRPRYPRVADVPQAFPGDFVADPPAY